MFIVLLKFSANKTKAAQFMEGHKAWLKRGFDDGSLYQIRALATPDPTP